METIIAYITPFVSWHGLIFLCVLYITGMIIQGCISSAVMVKRRHILREEYEFSDSQIMGFFWKSVLLFPLTWSLFASHGMGMFKKKIFNKKR